LRRGEYPFNLDCSVAGIAGGRERSFEVVVGCTIGNDTEDDTKIEQYNFPNYQCVF